MITYHDEILEEVHRNKAKASAMYDGSEAFHKQMTEMQLQMEKEGWKFVNINEVRERNYRRQMAGESD
jgi:hypothetical protein